MAGPDKKITLDLLNEVSTSGNVVDDLLEKEMQQIDQEYGRANEGLSTKILSLFTQGDKRVQLSEEEVVAELMEKRMVKKEVVWEVLSRLEKAGIIYCTNGNRYQLANNTLATRVNKKVATETLLLNNMRVVINDHINRKELLDKQYLDHIEPFLTRLELNDEQCDLVERSKAAVKKERRQRALIFWIILAALAALTTWALFERGTAIESQRKTEDLNAQLENRNDSLEIKKRELEQTLDDLNQARERAEAAANKAEEAEEEATRLKLIAEDIADQLQATNDSLEKKQISLQDANRSIKRINERLEDVNKDLEDKNKEANDARELAEKERRQAELLAVSLNSAVRSESIEDPRIQSLIARQSYSLFLEYLKNDDAPLKDPDGNNPYIFSALYKSLRSLAPDIRWSVKGHAGSVNDIIIHPDGKQIYTASSDGTVRQWDIDKWESFGVPDASIRELIGIDPNKVYTSIDLSANQQNLLVGGQLDRLQLYNFNQGFVIEDFLIPANTFKQDDKAYAVLFREAVDSSQVAFISRTHYFSSKGNLLSKSVRMIDFLASEKLDSRANTILKVRNQVVGLTANTRYEGDRFYLEVQKMDRGVGDIEELNFSREVKERRYGQAVAIAAQQKDRGGLVAIGLETGHLIILRADLLGGRMLRQKDSGLQIFRYHNASISDITFSNNGNYMAVASLDGTISIWDLRFFLSATYQPLVIRDHTDWVKSLAFANDDRMLVAGSQDGRVYFWNFHSPEFADEICARLQSQGNYPNYDFIDEETWIRFFGDKIEKDDHICSENN